METSKKQTTNINATEFARVLLKKSIRDQFNYVKFIISCMELEYGNIQDIICKYNFLQQFMYDKITINEKFEDAEFSAIGVLMTELQNSKACILNRLQIEILEEKFKEQENSNKEIYIKVPNYLFEI